MIIVKKIYLWLSSLRGSIYVLGLLCVFFLLGTVFPQGRDIALYEERGGAFLPLVKLLDLLNIFNSVWFLSLSFIFFLCLLFCAIRRYGIVSNKEKGLPKNIKPRYSLRTCWGVGEANEEAFQVIEKTLNFKRIGQNDGWVILQKGLYYKWLTWLYHAAIIACFPGLLLSGFFMTEGILTLEAGKETEIKSMMGDETLGWLVSPDHPLPSFTIILDEFLTEYVEFPELIYPDDKRSRFAIALGWKDLEYELKENSLFPKDWLSRLRLIRGGETVAEKTIEVNHPLKFESYSFYQLAYTQTLNLRINNSKELIEVDTGRRAQEIAGLNSKVKVGTLRTGTLFKLNGTKVKISPFLMMKEVITDAEGKVTTREEQKLELGKSIIIDGDKIELIDFQEKSMLSYRYDPGVPLLWVFGSLVFLIMALRCFGRWYMLAYKIEVKDGKTLLLLSVKSKGLLADPEWLKDKITRIINA
ncbi:MAG: cytochrome c biogenesis protein ResB [Deltaproteobacteria bacterium]|nr:cytochrome c biogenesis protein ResB [Deltaproteobacteria bacterium]